MAQNSQLIFDKGERQYTGAKIVFSTNAAGTTGKSHAKKPKTKKPKPKPNESRPRSYPFHKTWHDMDHRPVKSKTVKLIEDHTEEIKVTLGLVMTFQIQHQKHHP